MGRKSLGGFYSGPSRVVTTRFGRQDLAELAALAEAWDAPRSEVVRRAVREAARVMLGRTRLLVVVVVRDGGLVCEPVDSWEEAHDEAQLVAAQAGPELAPAVVCLGRRLVSTSPAEPAAAVLDLQRGLRLLAVPEGWRVEMAWPQDAGMADVFEEARYLD